MLDAELLVRTPDLEALAPEWDALAVANAQPMSAPAWMLGWLRHLAPAGAAARVVAVRERGSLVGLAPLFVEPARRGRVDYRLLGGAVPRTSPLSLRGREWEVAAAIAGVLARTSPRVDALTLESTPLASHWSAALRERWPGVLRPIARDYYVQSSLTVSLRGGSFEAWLAGKSPSFRREMRRHQRGFQARGGSYRTSTRETLASDIQAFMRLHAQRWSGRGASSIVAAGEGMSAMMSEVGAEQLDSGRFRLSLLEIDGEPICAQLCAAAGGEVLFLNGGWDERFAALSPSILNQLHALRDGFERGDARVDMGPGQQAFKLRMADGNDPVAWTILMIPGRRLALTYARTAPMLARNRVRGLAKRALPDEQADRLRELRSRLRRR
jgi:CelD/BcsL family acetyltransferase involved in cellulose biosynthesis